VWADLRFSTVWSTGITRNAHAHADKRNTVNSLRFNSEPSRGITMFEGTTASSLELTEVRNGADDLDGGPKVLPMKEPEPQTRSLQVLVDWTQETDV
jgi:hypothetical protein